MELKDLAPWIAVSITLALSILVPVFTQIANNRHQRKMQQEQFEHEKQQKKEDAFAAFLSDVGGIVTASGRIDHIKYVQAGSAIHKLYVYVSKEWYDDLDRLTGLISDCEWEKAQSLMQKLVRLIPIELKKEENR